MIGRVLRRVGRRRVLVMVDQGLSSVSNVVVTVMVARHLPAVLFGAFSVAMVAYQLAIGGIRAVVGEPWLSARSADIGPARQRASGDLARAAVAAALVASAAMGVAALLMGGAAAAALVALALAFPFLAAQDGLRYVAVVDRPQVAAASDLVWLMGVLTLLALAPAGATPAWFVGAWGVSGAAGLVVALVLLRVPLWSGSARRWFRSHRELVGAFLAEVASARAAVQVVLLGLGAIAGLAALGAVRAAQVFYGPLNTLFGGAYLALVPDGVRNRAAPRRLLRLMLMASAVVAGSAGAWTLVGQVLPDAWGTALFGSTWAEAQDVLLPVGLATMAGSVTTGAFAGIRSLGVGRLSLRARAWSLPPQVLCALVGAFAGAAVGYSIGLAIGNVLVAAIWWSMFLAAIRRREAKHLVGSPHRSRGPAVELNSGGIR